MIKPGQTEEVKVSVSTTKPKGKFAYKLPVTTTDAEKQKTTVTCAGHVRSSPPGTDRYTAFKCATRYVKNVTV